MSEIAVTGEYALFPTLVMTFDLSNHKDYSLMLDVVKNTETSSHGIMANNSESSYDERKAIDWLEHKDLKDFKEQIQLCVQYYSMKYELIPNYIKNSWMNRVFKSGRVKLHQHPGSVISGAFYPIADEGSCPLILRSPVSPNRMCETTRSENLFNAYSQEIPCIQGQLTLFPSWLEHFTDENPTDNRITVSFNTFYANGSK
jgi:uncharacterized protein (TIGR02466 family)